MSVLWSLDNFQWYFFPSVSSLCVFPLHNLIFFEATWKSMVSLNPPWNRIFRGENVTLTCNGNNSFEVSSTKWTHNNTMLVVTTASLEIINATIQDSGEYRCQNKNFIPSQPVYLEVFSGKFQGYGNIDSLMWEMAHLNLGRKQVIPRLRVPGWDSGSLTQDPPISFFHFYSFYLPALLLFSPSMF